MTDTEFPHRRGLNGLGTATAFRLDERLFRKLSQRRPTRPSWTVIGVLLAVISVLVSLAVVAVFGIGVWLLTVHPTFQHVVAGVLAICVALIFRPRFGRLPPKRDRIGYAEAPALFDLVREVAKALGGPAPDCIVLDLGRSASVQVAGLHRELVLRIGAELWVALSPSERIAMLAHEMGHRVNGDPTRSLLAEPVLNAFGRLSDWTGANRTLRMIFHPDRYHPPRTALIGEVALWAVSRVFLFPYLVLVAISAPGRKRAEYLADGMAAQIAGTDAAVTLMDKILLFPEIDHLIDAAASYRRPAEWRGVIDRFVAGRREQLIELRTLDTHHPSLWESHPPAGRRAEMLLAWPDYAPAMTIGVAQEAALDSELRSWIVALHREILGTRDFHDRSSRRAV
jgi:Zn-dependent protease with chaperone function